MSVTELTEEVHHKIVTAIAMGSYTSVAARYAGVDERTFYEWLAAGKRALPLRELEQCSLEDLQQIAQNEGVSPNGTTRVSVLALRIYREGNIYRRFAAAIDQADAECEVSAGMALRRAWDNGDWRAAESFLKRKHAARWSDKMVLEGDFHHRIAPEDDDQAPGSLDELGLSAEDVENLGRVLAQQQSGRLPAPADVIVETEEEEA